MIGRLILAAVAGLAMAPQVVVAATLEDVKTRGFVQCGVSNGVPGFSATNAESEWRGLEVDYCRAVAAAIFNDADSVRYRALLPAEQFTALTAGEIDILARATAWTMRADTQMGIRFVGTLFFDGQGFLVRRESGLKSALDLGGQSICFEGGGAAEQNARDYFAGNGMEVELKPLPTIEEALKSYEDKGCAAFSGDSSVLAGLRTRLADPAAHMLLPEIISKEPLGPSVRQGDDNWFNLTRWVFFALINAEELGVTAANVDELLGSDNPAIRRLLGLEGDYGEAMGLDKDWAYRVIKHVGNYGELFDRHFGAASPLGLERGVNALWTKGGIQYAPPVR